MPAPETRGDAESEEESGRRVRRIVARARREVAFRDVLSFGVARVWIAAAAVGGVMLALLFRPKTKDQ